MFKFLIRLSDPLVNLNGNISHYRIYINILDLGHNLNFLVFIFRKKSPFNPEKQSVMEDTFFEKNTLKNLLPNRYCKITLN